MLGETSSWPSVQRTTSSDQNSIISAKPAPLSQPLDGKGLVAMLEGVTIRTMVHAAAIKGLDALKLWHEILQARCQQDLRAVTVDLSAHVTENSLPEA